MQLAKLLWSSVGKKLLTGVTGLGLSGFVAAHLAGNLLLLTDNPDPFNEYAHFLHTVGHGKVLYLMEFGLIAFFFDSHRNWCINSPEQIEITPYFIPERR